MTTEGRLGVTWVIIIILAIALAIHFWVLVWYTYKGLKSLTTDEDGTNNPIDNNQSMSISKMNIPENYLKEEQNRLEELQAKNEPVDEQINLEFGTDDELERIRSTSQGKRRFIKKLGLQI
jgi:peroxiredoxin family protein